LHRKLTLFPISAFAGKARAAVTSNPTDNRRIVAILAADVVGYSRLVSIDEPGTLRRISSLRTEVFEPEIATWGGRIFREMGDCYFAEFNSVVSAVNCAAVLQKKLKTYNQDFTDDQRIQYRMAAHLSDILDDRGDPQGDGVNIAARLQECAEPGGIVVSATAYDYLRGRINLPLEDIGEQQLKNMPQVRAYRVRLTTGVPSRLIKPVSFKRPIFVSVGVGLTSIGLIVIVLLYFFPWIVNPPLPVFGYVGGSKANLLENPDVMRVLEKKYQLRVEFEPIGGREQVCDIKKSYDFLWPGTLVSVEDYKRCHDGTANFNSMLFSPIVIYTWEPVIEALSSAKLIERRSDGVSFIDTDSLVPLLLEHRTPWPPALGLRGNILVSTSDPTKSNSGEMFAAMLAKVRLGQAGLDIQKTIPEIRNYFAQFEPKPSRTSLLFQDCYGTGMRTCPMFVAYESLLLDYINENELNCTDIKSIRVIYPRPTIWATHPMIATTEKGERLLAALRDPIIQKIAWDKHGFRIGSRTDGPKGCQRLPDSDEIPSLQLPTLLEREALQKALH
jgi:class 3 adenylate cyclase